MGRRLPFGPSLFVVTIRSFVLHLLYMASWVKMPGSYSFYYFLFLRIAFWFWRF